MPKLTDSLLMTLTVGNGPKDRLVFDTACPGLGVRVTAKGTRTFIAQWTDPATKRKVREPLGVWGNLTIAHAREAAKVRLGEVAKGINPRAERLRLKAEDERTRAEAALSFEVLVDEWAELHLAHRRQRYRDEAQRAIKFVFADLLKRPAARSHASKSSMSSTSSSRMASSRWRRAPSPTPARHSTRRPNAKRYHPIHSWVFPSSRILPSAIGC